MTLRMNRCVTRCGTLFLVVGALLVGMAVGSGCAARPAASLSGSVRRVLMAAVTIHVAPDGRDGAAGSRRHPLRTLAAARRWLAEVIASNPGRIPEGGLKVVIHAGTYELSETLELGPADSGGKGSPIVWRGAGDGDVRIVGGKRVRGWQPLADRAILDRLVPEAAGQVMVCDLPALGIPDPGRLSVRGFSKPMSPVPVELFYRHEPMTLARWPNAPEFATITEVPDGQDGLRFGYGGGRTNRWAGEPDLWVFAYFFHDWADVYQPIKAVDSAGRRITLSGPKPEYGMRQGQRFYVLNALAELDSPGEYYVDRATGRLYFWPPQPLADGDCEVSVLDNLLVLKGCGHIEFRGLTFEVCRGQALVADDVRHVRVLGCTLRNTGTRGASLSGRTSGFTGCNVYNNGEGGLAISGGDRKTLAPGEMFADNNHIREYSRWARTYRPGISVNGVGNRVAHNGIHHGPHAAVLFGGNLNIIEFNEIHNVCYETGDVGAIYAGRDWTQRGNVIRNNFFHHIEGPGALGAMGVYLDDAYCGTIVESNLFYKVTRAVFIGGGCDTVVANNMFVDCTPAVHIDNRGMGWMKAATDDPQGTLRSRLREVDYQHPPYSDRWPELVNILNDDPGVPKRNRILRNISIGGHWDDIHQGTRHLQTIADNAVDPVPGLLYPDRVAGGKRLTATDFVLDPACPAFGAGFKALPLDRMGRGGDRAGRPGR